MVEVIINTARPESIEGMPRLFTFITIHIEQTIMSSSRTLGSMGSENRHYRWISAFAGMTDLLNVANNNKPPSLLELHS